MKKTISVLLAAITLLCALPFSALAADRLSQTDAATGANGQLIIRFLYNPDTNSANVEWDAYEGASRYMVQLLNSYPDNSNYARVSKSEISASQPCKASFGAESFSDYGWGGMYYYFEVVAYGSDSSTVIAFGRSDHFTTGLSVLDEPQEVKLSKNGVASWGKSSQTDQFRLYLYNPSDEEPLLVIGVEGESYDLSSYMVSDQYYYIRVRAEAPGYRYSKLIMSDTVVYVKQSVSGISWRDYLLSWAAYPGAANYRLILYIREPDKQVVGKVTSELSYDLTDELDSVYRQYGTVSCYVRITALKADSSALSLSTDSPLIRTGKLIESASCTISAPVGGEHPDYDPIPLNGTQYYVEPLDWYLYESPYPHLSPSDTFTAGKRYAFRVKFTAKDGYRLDDSKTTYSVNGSYAVSVGNHIREFVMTASQGGSLITSAGCTITPPAAGQSPTMTAVPLDGGKYEAQLQYWYLNVSPYPHLSAGDTFESGKKYVARVKFVAKDGFRLDNDTTVFTINGVTPRTVGNCIRDWVVTASDGIPIETVDCMLTTPRVGDHPDLYALAVDDDKYTASVDKWYLDTAPDYPQVTEDGYFQKDKRYAVRVDYIPKNGYCFDENTVVKIGGNVATRVGVHTWEYVYDVLYADISLSGTCESYIDNYTTVILLIKQGETSASYHTYQNAKTFEYRIPDIEPGVYTVRVSKRDHVTREYTVDIHGMMNLDVKICPIGDADGNGRVNAADAKAAFQHSNEQKLIEDDYKFKCADVASPKGKINSADAKAIFQHANEQKSLWSD